MNIKVKEIEIFEIIDETGHSSKPCSPVLPVMQ
jgi:hypothetical protein